MLKAWLIAVLLAMGGCATAGDGFSDAGHAVHGIYIGGSGGYGVR